MPDVHTVESSLECDVIGQRSAQGLILIIILILNDCVLIHSDMTVSFCMMLAKQYPVDLGALTVP